MKKGQKGFTLVEMMIALAIILVLAIIAVPNLIRAKITTNETGAIAACRAICNSCNFYFNQNNDFPSSIAVLGPSFSNPPYIDADLAVVSETNDKDGYYYTYSTHTTRGFYLYANPRTGFTGKKHFALDAKCSIHYTEEDRDATEADPVL